MKIKHIGVLWSVITLQGLMIICLWIMVDKLQTQYRAPIETITELRPIIHNEYWGGADKYERILNYFGLEEKVTPATDEKITLQKRLK